MNVSAEAARHETSDDTRATPPSAIPFPGLESFTEPDAAFFFGREGDRRIITANLQASRLTILYGASGVGKSSVLLAGVVADLRRRALERARRSQAGKDEQVPFAVAVYRSWSVAPLAALVERIREAAMEALGGEYLEPWDPSRPLVETLEEWTERTRYLYVVLDQFEEYFLYNPPSDADDSFDVQLARILSAPDLRVHVLISLREDALSLLDRFKGAIPHLLDNYLRIDHLDLDAAKEAIERPLDAYNELHAVNGTRFAIEPELVGALTESEDLRARREVQTEGGAVVAETDGVPRIETPYLQLVLRSLWLHEETQREQLLRKRTLVELGGPRQIVRGHLEAAMNALSPSEQELAADVFRFLVTSSNTKIAHTPGDLAEFVGGSEDEIRSREGEIRSLLDKLCAGNRIVRRIAPPADPSRDPTTPEPSPRYELFHDVLAGAVLRWRDGKLAERNARLETERSAEAVRKAQADARMHRRRAAFALGLAAVATVGLIFAVLSLLDANRARDTAKSERLASVSADELLVDPAQSVRDALAALNARDTQDAERALRASLPSLMRLRAVVPSPDIVSSSALVGANAKYAAVLGWDGRVRVWDWRSSRELAVFPTGGSSDVDAIGDGGRYLFTNGPNAAIWDLDRCRSAKCAPLQSLGAADAISSDGSVAAIKNSESVDVHPTGRCFAKRGCGPVGDQELKLPFAIDLVESVAVSPTGAFVAAGTLFGKVVVWDTRPGADSRLHILAGGAESQEVDRVAFSRDGSEVVGVSGKLVRVWRNVAGCPRTCRPFRVERHPGFVYGAMFDNSGHLLLTSSDDGVARIWNLDVPTTAPAVALGDQSDIIFDAKFAAGGNLAITSGADRTARVWDVGTGQVLPGSRGWVNGAAFDGHGKSVATASADGHIRVYDPSMGRMTHDFTDSHGVWPVYAVVLSANGNRLVSADGNGNVYLWLVHHCGQGCPKSLTDEYSTPLGVAFAPDESMIAVAGGGGGWGIVTLGGRTLATMELAGKQMQSRKAVIHAEFSPHGNYVVTASLGGLTDVWDVRGCRDGHTCTPVLKATLPSTATVYSAAFDPSGARIVTAGGDRVVRVWRWRDLKAKPLLLSGNMSDVRDAEFSDDGTRIVTAGADGTTRVWDARSGRLLDVFRTHGDIVNTAVFAPRDSSTILTASDDGTAMIDHCTTMCGPLKAVRKAAEKLEQRLDQPARRLESAKAWLSRS